MFLLVALLLYTVPAVICSSNSGLSKALKFTETGYIVFTPNMSPFVSKMSVCMWLRDLGSPGCCPTVFSYGPDNQVRIDSDGGYIYMANNGQFFQSELAGVVTKGDWYHTCLSWSSSSGSARYYVNGLHLGTVTSSGTLSTGHNVALGNHAHHLNPFLDSNIFTGEVSKLNVYAKEVTAEEVKRMFSGGLCGLWEEENEDVRVLKWEDILKLPRTGSVSDESLVQCTPQELLKECERVRNETSRQLSESLKTLENVRAELNTTLSDKQSLANTLAETQTELNTTALTLAEAQTELNTTLAEKESLSQTLGETQSQLNTTVQRLDEALEQIQSLNRTWDWDMFSLDEYLNRTVSPKMAEQLRSSWDGISGWSKVSFLQNLPCSLEPIINLLYFTQFCY